MFKALRLRGKRGITLLEYVILATIMVIITIGAANLIGNALTAEATETQNDILSTC